MEPFDLLPHDEPERRWFGGERSKRDAYVELHNLIAAAASRREFGPAHVARIEREHEVDFRRDFADERQALYARYLRHSVADGALTPEERATLEHLAATLHITPAALAPIHREVFGDTVSGALTDDCLDVGERLLLYTMQHTLGLEPGVADVVYEKEARTRLMQQIAHALCDGKLSDMEEAEILRVAGSLDLAIPEHVRALLDRAAARWALEHGDLPVVDLGLRMLPEEVGHFSDHAEWFEVNYAKFKDLASEHREAVHRHETDDIRIPGQALNRVDEGTVFVTSKRLVLVGGQRHPEEVKFTSLLGCERYRNGTRVLRRDARSLLVQVHAEADAFHLALSRAMHG
jgi:tellurite resistance protein